MLLCVLSPDNPTTTSSSSEVPCFKGLKLLAAFGYCKHIKVGRSGVQIVNGAVDLNTVQRTRLSCSFLRLAFKRNRKGLAVKRLLYNRKLDPILISHIQLQIIEAGFEVDACPKALPRRMPCIRPGVLILGAGVSFGIYFKIHATAPKWKQRVLVIKER